MRRLQPIMLTVRSIEVVKCVTKMDISITDKSILNLWHGEKDHTRNISYAQYLSWCHFASLILQYLRRNAPKWHLLTLHPSIPSISSRCFHTPIIVYSHTTSNYEVRDCNYASYTSMWSNILSSSPVAQIPVCACFFTKSSFQVIICTPSNM